MKPLAAYAFPAIRMALTGGLALIATDSASAADARVELELIGEGQAAAMTFHEWARALGGAGIEHVRFRSARPTDRVGIQKSGTPELPRYTVTGIVRGRNELLLPGGRYRRGDVERLAAWIDELARLGPPEQRAPRGAFGLTADQYRGLLEDLARPVPRSTVDQERLALVEALADRLATPLSLDESARQSLRVEEVARVRTELEGLAVGTSLAYLLRPAGLCLAPAERDGEVVLSVVRSRPGLEIWPIGFEPDQPTRELVPALYAFRDVRLENVAVRRVIDAIAGQLNLPVLMDRNALVRFDIDPDETMVSLPRQTRTTYSLVLQKALFQARLKAEVRTDEAGKPVLWVTSLKPL